MSKSNIAHRASEISSNYIVSTRTVANKPNSRLCPVKAQWFTIPQAIVKTLLLTFSLVLILLMLTWESEGVRIFQLDDSIAKVNYRNHIYSYIAVAFLTIVYCISMTMLGCGGCEIPAIPQAFVSGAYLLAWLITSAVISAAVENLSHTRFARDRQLNLLQLQLANGSGFLVVFFFTLDIFLTFMALRALEERLLETAVAVESSKSGLRVTTSTKHITGRGSYRHRQSAIKRLSEPQDLVGTSNKTTNA